MYSFLFVFSRIFQTNLINISLVVFPKLTQSIFLLLYFPTTLCINHSPFFFLGSSSYCDVSNHVLKWDWFVIEARFIHHDGTSSGNSGRGGEEVHIEDVQLFRSKNGTKSISTPQLSIQMGLKLNKKEKEGPLKK